MILSVIVFLIFLLLILLNFERGVVISFVVSTWLNCFSIGFFTSYTLLVMFISLFFAVRYRLGLKYLKDYPLLFVSLCFLASMVLTNFYAAKSHVPQLISTVLTNVFMVFVIWVLFRKKPVKLLRIFLRTCTVYAIVIGIYAIFEVVTSTNLYIDFCHSIDALVNEKTITEVRFGLKRAQSVFTMHTSLAGVAYHLLAVFMFCRSSQHRNNIQWLLLALLMAITVLLTGARSGMIAVAVCLLCLVSWRNLKSPYILFLLLLVVVGVSAFGNYFSEIYNSIVNSDDEAIGSSQGMRETQFDIGFMFLFKSFWFGNGIGFIAEATKTARELLGAESMWLPLMIEYGIVGVACYVLYYIACMKFVFSRLGGGKNLVFYVLGALVLHTLTSVPSLIDTYLFCYLMFISYIRKRAVPIKP